MPDNKVPKPSDILGKSSVPSPADILGGELKKKISADSATGGYGSAFGSPSFQGSEQYVPSPLIGKGVEEYKKRAPKIKPQVQEAKSFTENLEPIVASGLDALGSMVSSIPSGLVNVAIQAFGNPVLKETMDAESLGKLIEKETGLKEKYNPLSPNNYVTSLYRERGEKAASEIKMKYDGSIENAIKAGDYTEAGKMLALRSIQALPVSIGLIASRGAGASEAASLIGLGLGTQSTELERLKQEYPDIDKNTLVVNSILSGLGEAGSELVGTSLLYNQASKLFAKGAKEEAEQLVKGGVKSFLDNAFKKSFVGSAVLSDASGEMANQVWKNFVDKETVDPSKNLSDGVLDAGLISIGSTAPIAGASKVVSTIINPKVKETIKSNTEKIDKITKDLDNPDVNDTTKALLLNQLSDATEQLNDELDNNTREFNSLTEEGKKEVTSIVNQIADLNDSLKSPDISEDAKTAINTQLENLNNRLQDAVQKSSTAGQVSPVIEGGQVIAEGGEGVGQSVQGQEAPQEIVAQEEVVSKPQPGEKVVVSNVSYTVPTQEEQDALRELRTQKAYFDTKVNELPSSSLTAEEVDNILSNGKFGILTGQNPMGQPVSDQINNKLNRKAKRWLKDKGYGFYEIAGKYGQTEGSLLVPDLSPEDAIAFAKEFNQESVVTNDGLVYQDGSMNPRVKEDDSFTIDVSQPDTDFASAIKLSDGSVKGFSLGLNFDETVKAPVSEPSAELQVLPKQEEPVAEEVGGEQKRLGASRIVGEAITPEETVEFEEVPVEGAEGMLKESLETPFRNKEKLDKTSKSITSKIIKAAFDSQIEVIQKLLKQGGDIGKIVVATLKNRKGYNGKASIINRSFNKEIFDDLNLAPNIDIAGRKTSERELFDVFLNLKRIINIDARISDKFAQLVQVDRKIKDGVKNKTLTDEQLSELRKEEAILKDYLENRKALKVVNGEYVPVQYLHSGGRTAASANAELNVLKEKLPNVYKKLDKAYDSYTDAFRFLLDEQFKNGMISKKVYDELFSYNYIPTKYIQHFVENELSQDNPALSSKLSSSIKNLTGGSDSDVITNFQTILELYTNSVYKRIYENRAAKSLAKSVRSTGEQSRSLAKTNQLVKGADAKISDKPMYNIDLDMYIQEPTGEDKFGNPTYGDVPTGYDVIYFYDKDGKRERIVASKDFVDTWYDRGGLLSPKGEEYLSNIPKWSGVNLFKSLITKNNPAFGIYQILQDAPQALIATEAYPDFILGSMMLAKDYASVAGDISSFIKNDKLTPLFKEAIDAGIFSDFLSTESDLLRSQSLVNADGTTNYKTALKSLRGRFSKGVDNALNSIAQFNEAVEYSTRLAVYKRMKQNLIEKYKKENSGVEPSGERMFEIQQLAAEQARNVVDFSRSGTVVKPLNKVLAYLNAGIQAFYSSARSLKNNPVKAGVMLTEIGLGGVAVLAMSLGQFSDNEREKKKRLAEYLMLSKYQRSNYFNIYNPYTDDEEKRWLKIPKPQGFRGWINMLEQGYLSSVLGVDIDEKTVKEAFSNDLPVEPSILDLITRNPLVNATIKYSLNKDVFRNEDIVKNAEKIEDWAEGVDDEKVSKLYKNLGESTRGLIGEEGISPKRAQAFMQSLIGDPSRNTTTAIIDKAGKAIFYLATDNKEGLNEEFTGNVADDIFKMTGLKGRLFTSTPKMDNTFMENLDEQRRELFTKRLLIRAEIEDIYETAPSLQEAKKLSNERLNELVKNKDITPQYKKRILAAEEKQSLLKDKPSWYKSLLYSESNDEKIQILKHYTKGMSDDEYKKAAMFLLQNKIVTPEVTREFAKVRVKK